MSDIHLTRPSSRRGAPPRGERLTRNDVVAAASGLIEKHGSSNFSLRSLAAYLEVRPSALYNHVHGKADLLDAVTARFVSGFELPAAHDDWQAWIRSAAHSLYVYMVARPALAELMLSRAGSTSAGQALMRRFIDRLGASGLSPELAHVAWHVALTVVIGAATQDLARESPQEPTFNVVLDIAIDGIVAAGDTPPSPRAADLLSAHGKGQELLVDDVERVGQQTEPFA